MSIGYLPAQPTEADRDALLEAVRELGSAADQRFVLGERTRAFEARLRGMLGAADVIACSSGTAALTMVLHAIGVGPGDEVIVPALGCPPLASAVVCLGAVPVFADVDPVTLALDADRADALVTARTRVVVPAHVSGVMADMPRYVELAARLGLRLVEDSAAAQGAVLDGRAAGTWGEAGLYSFGPGKALELAGAGGAVVTRYPALGRAVRMLRDHGRDVRASQVCRRVGHDSRFDEVQAAFALHRLSTHAARLERRARIADYYTDCFAPLRDRGLLAPPAGRNGRCFGVYLLLTDRRTELQAHLAARGVEGRIPFPAPLPCQPAFAGYAPEGRRWPHAAAAAARMLAVPAHAQLTNAQVEHIARSVCSFYGDAGAAAGRARPRAGTAAAVMPAAPAREPM